MKECPSCGVAWQESQRIYQTLMKKHGYSEEEAKQRSSGYGDTDEHPQHFGVNCCIVEFPEIYDGHIFTRCDNCKSYHARPGFEERCKRAEEEYDIPNCYYSS